MCSLVTWIGVFPGAPLVVAANRDERLGRPSTGPQRWPTTPALVAPRDELVGGTWWAVNEHGLFVGVTNRAGTPPDPARRSRGLLVTDVARARTVDEAEAILRAIEEDAYNGFHLFACDARAGVRAIAADGAPSIARVGPGLHVLTEWSFGAGPPDRPDAVVAAFEAIPRDALDLEMLARTLARHGETPQSSVCVHIDALDYGTRSSTLLVLGGPRPTLRFADGPPCRTAFEDLSSLLEDLGC
jgi:hypothetical protein